MGDTALESTAARPVSGLRIEDWLLALAAALREEPGAQCALAYDDRFRGDRIALTLRLMGGACELQVTRQVRSSREGGKGKGARELGATLILLAEKERPAALQVLAERSSALHRGISRLRNARRKFTHRVASLAQQLQRRREVLALEFPQEPLEQLRALLPQATAMVGVEGRFRAGGLKEDEDEDDGAVAGATRTPRREARYLARFGAWIPGGDGDEGGRAAIFYAGTRSFQLVGAAGRQAAQALHARAGEQGGASGEAALTSVDPAAFAIRNPIGELRGLGLAGAGAAAALAVVPALTNRQPTNQASTCDRLPDCDAGDVCEVLDCLDVLPDIGSCDLPDCNSCDVPDLSCDVGSCDGLSCDL